MTFHLIAVDFLQKAQSQETPDLSFYPGILNKTGKRSIFLCCHSRRTHQEKRKKKLQVFHLWTKSNRPWDL